MEKVVLGKTGLEVTRIGFGGIPIQRLTVDEAVEVITKALDMGVGLIDTARVYTDSEIKIGAALAASGKKPVLVSKTYSRDAGGVRRDVGISAENLGVSHIHVYLMHNINSVELLEQVLQPGGAMEGLATCQAEGKIGFTGISSHKAEVIQAALEKDLFDVVEVPFNALEQNSQAALSFAHRNGIGTIVMKPLAGGVLKPASSAIKYVLSHPVHCVIPGMQTLKEVEDNLSISTPLSEKELEKLLAEAEKWKGRFCRKCEYCLSECPHKINITLILLFHLYFKMYGLTKWARDRYGALPIRADICGECGRCEKKCPYELPIIEMLKEAHHDMK